jgi:hypothetical protein
MYQDIVSYFLVLATPDTKNDELCTTILQYSGKSDDMIYRLMNLGMILLSLFTLAIVIQIIRVYKEFQVHPAGLIKTICIVEALQTFSSFLQSDTQNPAYFVCYGGIHSFFIDTFKNWPWILVITVHALVIVLILQKSNKWRFYSIAEIVDNYSKGEGLSKDCKRSIFIHIFLGCLMASILIHFGTRKVLMWDIGENHE